MKLNPDHVQWQKNLLDALTIGGTWGIPAYGAIIKRVGEKQIEIVNRGDDEDELALLIAHIEAAGYSIWRPELN